MAGGAQKRSAGASSGASSPASKKQKQPQQPSITSFFTSPSSKNHKPTSDGISITPKKEPIASSAGAGAGGHDDEDDRMDPDERLARQLQAEWDAEAQAQQATPSKKQLQSSSTAAASPASSASAVASSSKLQLGGSAALGSAISSSAAQAAKLSKPGGVPPPINNPTVTAADIDLNALDAAIEAVPLGEDIFSFDPYTVDTSVWPHTVPSPKQPGPSKPIAPYALLTHAFVLISSTKSRITITTVLTNLLRVLRLHDPEAILPAVYLISNHIAPPYDGVELGIGGSVVNKAIQSVTGKTNRFLKNLWDRTGDPGDVAFEAKKDVKMLTKPVPITVAKLFATLHTIARLSGAGSQSAKLSHVTKLLVASRGEETRFLISKKAPSLKARGKAKAHDADVADGPLDSPFLIRPEERRGLLAHPSKTKDRQNPRWIELSARMTKAERLVREVRARHPNFSSIVPGLLEVGIDGLSERVPLRVGTPLSPMLASITRSLASMHDKLGSRPFVSEYKYDGQRVQIHAALLTKNGADGLLPDDPLFASGNMDGDASLRTTLKDSGRGKWIKAGEDATQEVYVRLFSRHLEDQTEKYPDVLELVPILLGFGATRDAQSGDGNVETDDHLKERKAIHSFIMDAEVVAIGTSSDELLPFQTLAGRSRKDVQLKDVKVKVGIFAFDLMYLNGQSLLKTSFRQRRELLKRHFPPIAPSNPLIACFDHVKSCESMEPEDVQNFFEQARAAHCEGIMVKSLDHFWEDAAPASGQDAAAGGSENAEVDGSRLRKLNDVVGNDMEMEDIPDEDRPKSLKKGKQGSKIEDEDVIVGKGVNGRGKALLSTYEPDKRCESWLKVKSDYLDSQDTLDLVPIGGWHGMGRKAQWWSPVLLALYDPETGVYQALCKCISGFTDAEYKRIKFEAFAENTDDCQEATSSVAPFEVEYDSALIPAFWWRPKEVWEIRCADITLSPVYTAARGHDLGLDTARGLSIRFPRFMRRRDDKGVEQATTPGQLAKMFREQMARGPVSAPAAVHQGDDDDDDDAGDDDDGEDEAGDEVDAPGVRVEKEREDDESRAIMADDEDGFSLLL
ncbi:hypothetical protein OC834_001250 [Tilletia horrida]|nr:hypothetical protein OC834_001250 [Tilletia horrida]